MAKKVREGRFTSRYRLQPKQRKSLDSYINVTKQVISWGENGWTECSRWKSIEFYEVE